MTFFTVFVISGFSILLPTVAGVLKRKALGSKYLPLLILLLVGLCNESLNYYLIVYVKARNMTASNIYVLVELLLITWLFHNMKLLLSKKFLITIVVIGTTVWIADNLVVNSLCSNNSLFRMVASFMVIFLSIERINQHYFATGWVQSGHTDILLSSGFLAYFLYKAFIEAFHLFPMHLDKSSYITLWLILAVINFIVNILFAIAILCIQRKNQFSLHS